MTHTLPAVSNTQSAQFPSLQRIYGHVQAVNGFAISVAGLDGLIPCGALIAVHVQDGQPLIGEVIRLGRTRITAMMFSGAKRIKIGDCVERSQEPQFAPSQSWLGQVLDFEGRRIDGSRPQQGQNRINIHAKPPKAFSRRALGSRLTTTIAAIDTCLPLCRGQRMGLFAGSGVGKSTLLGQIASNSHADVNVVALIGERGREVGNFVNDIREQGGLENTIVFAATSDQPSAVKLRTANLAIATAEAFRDQGRQVLFLFDSLSRYAEAHRDKALSAGELPALRAYPPSTFSALAQYCERAGPGRDIQNCGDITAIFSVLVAGGDMEEPVADMIRGILDGHILLDREIADRGRYPAINILKSVSRSLPGAASAQENDIIKQARSVIATYENSQTIIQSGLYVARSDPEIDRALQVYPRIETFLTGLNQTGSDMSFERLSLCLQADDQQND